LPPVENIPFYEPTCRVESTLKPKFPMPKKNIWAVQRFLFTAYIVTASFSVVGGVITAPLLTHLFFRDWRFWLYWRHSFRLLIHAYKMMPAIALNENKGFMFSVPLQAPPLTSPDPSAVRLRNDWEHGKTCGPCMACCEKINCPLLDRNTSLCAGYDSPFWRYFNCGRFPTQPHEMEYYDCRKWILLPATPKKARAEEPRAGENMEPEFQPE